MHRSAEIIKGRDLLPQSHSVYFIMVEVSYHCPGEMRISVQRQYRISWSENDIEMRASILVEFGELQSRNRRYVSDSIMLTPVHCPSNPGDKSRAFNEKVSWPCWGDLVLITSNIPTEPHLVLFQPEQEEAV